jgi:FG-GAP-like repeat/Dockerin type I domain
MPMKKLRFRFPFHSLLLALPLICGSLQTIAFAQSNAPSFDGSRSYFALGAGQTGAAAVATGDFNRDGKKDIVVVTPETDGVSVFLNQGGGIFGKPVRYATGSHPNYVAVGDFNGDGKLDLITANTAANTVSVLLGNGDGTFQSPLDSPVGLFPSALAVGDFNHDGKLDVAVAGGSSGVGTHQLWVLLGNGDGTFQAPLGNTMTDYQYFVVAGDFNGDGNLDLVAGSSTDAWILLGNGDGTFQAPVLIGNGDVGPYGNSVAVGDINGDGKLDLAITNSNHEVSNNVPGTVTILLGNGNGTFLPPLVVQAGVYPYSVQMADFDGDGKLDLAVANTGDAHVEIFRGNGDGTFQAGTNYPVGANWATTIAIADFNGDGRPDVAVSSAFTDNVSVLLNKGNGTFHDVATFGVGTQPYAIAIGDFNHDGKLDLATADSATSAADPGSNKVSVLLGNGNGTFQAAVNYPVGTLPSSVAAADLNGDGNLDLAVVNHQDGNISILLGNGNGTFQAAVNYAAGTNAISLVVADFNGDGKLDLAVGSLGAGNTNQVSVLLGNGDGTFQAPLNSTVPGGGIDGLAVGDFNGDGKPDLASANYNSSNVVIMLGNGDGTFRPAPNAVSALGPVSVAAGDINGDGKADLIIGNYFTSQIAVQLGNGDGTFQPPNYYKIGNNPAGIVIADLNGDSKPDLAVVNVNDHFVSIFAGKGDGTFEDGINYGTSKGPSALVVGDLNGDGKPDLAMTGYWFNQVAILLNNTPAVQPLSAVSRKTHGSAGTFDINLPLTGTPGIECRSSGAGGDHQIVISFPWAVTFSRAAVTNGAGTVSSTSGSGTNKVTVNLTGVANAQTITVTLFNVSDGPNTVDVAVRMSVLLGDVNASGVVTSGDTNLCKAQALQPVTSANFRCDVNTSGAITTGDVNIIKQNALSHLPP